MESDQTGGDPVSETTSDVKLGSDPNSWAKFFRDTGFFQCDHALLTLFAPRDLGDQLIIGGHVALCHGIHYVNGTPRFLGTDVFIPPGAVADAVRDRIKEGIKYEMRKAGAPDILIVISSLVCKITALVNLDSDNLIQAVRELPEDGACFILSAELYRFKDLGVDSQSRPV